MPLSAKIILAVIAYAAFIHYVAKFCAFNNRQPCAHDD